MVNLGYFNCNQRDVANHFFHLGIKFAQSKFTLKIRRNGTTTLRCVEKGDLNIELLVDSQKYVIAESFSSKW